MRVVSAEAGSGVRIVWLGQVLDLVSALMEVLAVVEVVVGVQGGQCPWGP